MQHPHCAVPKASVIRLAALLLPLALAAPAQACTMTRSAPNEVTVRFGADCVRDTGGQSRLHSELAQAVFDLNALDAGGAAVAGPARTATPSPRRGETFTPTQRRLYALDQVEFDRSQWWARTFMPLRYYGQKK